MINVEDFFCEKLEYSEIGNARYHGFALRCPGTVTLPDDVLSEEQISKFEQKQKIKLPESLKAFYSQAVKLYVNWSVADYAAGKKVEQYCKYKEDNWLQENYIDKGYSWDAVKLLISGNLVIPTIHEMLSEKFLQDTGMYTVPEKFGLPKGSLLPIDTNEFAVACVKVMNGEILDNIYIYTGFGGLPEQLLDMKIGFEQYIELAYEAKCFNYWNVAYCLREKAPHYELMKRYLPKIFSHVELNLSAFGI